MEVTSPSAVRAIMSRYGLACRKSLGQNFLVDKNIIEKIIGAADLKTADLVVEIGPGLGALTKPAARSAARVLAVEVDRGLLPVLAKILEGAGDIEVIEGDALKIDFDEMVEEHPLCHYKPPFDPPAEGALPLFADGSDGPTGSGRPACGGAWNPGLWRP